MNDKVIMVHEITDQVISNLAKLPDSSVITLDDGLFSQYIYRDILKRFKRVIFFINPSILCTGKQSTDIISCRDAHQKAFNGIFENYVTLEQVQFLQQIQNFEIGSHSYNHLRFNSMKDLIKDIEKSLEFFSLNNIKIKSFCYPYNQNYNKSHFDIAVKNKFKDLEIFGAGRIAIEDI